MCSFRRIQSLVIASIYYHFLFALVLNVFQRYCTVLLILELNFAYTYLTYCTLARPFHYWNNKIDWNLIYIFIIDLIPLGYLIVDIANVVRTYRHTNTKIAT